MKGPREPSLRICGVCDKHYVGYCNDPCPRCGGDVDVAAFKRATDYRAECETLRAALLAAEATIAKQAAESERWEAVAKGLASAHAEKRLEVERMLPVVEAAKRWAVYGRDDSDDEHCLLLAVNALEKP